jgi:CO/xanthine dehydrogenase Mo-binding subunit
MEEIQLKDGRIANASFTDYLLPTTLDMPRVDVELIEEAEPDTPFGVKGVGEPSNVVAPAAIAAALRDALGIELNRIPVRPDDLVGLRGPRPMPAWPPFPDHPAREPSPARAGIHRTGEPT